MKNVHLKESAYRQFNIALRHGEIVKKACVLCSDENTDAHHYDYAKPLDVKWLCRRHHAMVHKYEGISPRYKKSDSEPIPDCYGNYYLTINLDESDAIKLHKLAKAYNMARSRFGGSLIKHLFRNHLKSFEKELI